MKSHTVFYADKFLLESDAWPDSHGTPDGSYMIWMPRGQWFIIDKGYSAINEEDVPKATKLLALLMK